MSKAEQERFAVEKMKWERWHRGIPGASRPTVTMEDVYRQRGILQPGRTAS